MKKSRFIVYRDDPKKTWLYLHKFALGRAALQHIRDGDGGVAVGEVGVVPTPGHGDAEPVARHPAQGHVVQLPGDPFSSLHTIG